LVCNTSGVEGHVGVPGWGLGQMTSESIIHMECTNQTTTWLMHSWNIFTTQTNHEQTQTHKTHHGPDLGEATTFPLIVLYVPSHGAYTQMSFCPEIGTLATLGAHNFLCKPLIEMKSKAKL